MLNSNVFLKFGTINDFFVQPFQEPSKYPVRLGEQKDKSSGMFGSDEELIQLIRFITGINGLNFGGVSNLAE